MPAKTYQLNGASNQTVARTLRQLADMLDAGKAQHKEGGMWIQPMGDDVRVQADLVLSKATGSAA